MAIYNKILVAVDLSKEAEQILKKAQKIAKQYDARISVIHVVEPVVIETTFDITPTVDLEIENDLIERSKNYINTLQSNLGMTIDEIFIPVGSTKHEIHAAAKSQNADLIIVGSHGRHGVSLLLGSTANAVLHGAPCDVLSVKVVTE